MNYFIFHVLMSYSHIKLFFKVKSRDLHETTNHRWGFLAPRRHPKAKSSTLLRSNE